MASCYPVLNISFIELLWHCSKGMISHSVYKPRCCAGQCYEHSPIVQTTQKSKGHCDRAQDDRCWISCNYPIVEKQFNVTSPTLGQRLCYTSVTCTVSDMASSMISVKGEGKECHFPCQAPVSWTQENQITFFIFAVGLFSGMGIWSVVSRSWFLWWQVRPWDALQNQPHQLEVLCL